MTVSTEKNNSNILAAFFWLYCIIALMLVFLLNRHTLFIFSADKIIGEATIYRLNIIRVVFLIFSILTLCLGYIFSKSKAIKRLSGTKINLLVSISIFAFIIFCLESVLYIRYSANYIFLGANRSQICLYDESLGIALNPALSHSYKINSKGFRGAEFDIKKQSNEIRIIAIGDSITFGWELSDETETYPVCLRSLFKKIHNAKFYNVINLGVPRYTSLQILRLIEKSVLALQPDLVILCLGWNDLYLSYLKNWNAHMLIKDSSSGFRPAISAAARDLSLKLSKFSGRENKNMPRTVNKEAVEFFESDLRKIIKILQENNIKILAINLPAVLSEGKMSEDEIKKARQFPETENIRVFKTITDNVCSEMKVPCLDVFALEVSGKGKYFLDHCHLTGEGNKFLAERIFAFLAEDKRFKEILL